MFTERFRQIMTLLGISAGELAKAAACDASNISRMYSGSRIPRCGGKAATRLVRGLCTLAEQTHHTGELCTLLGCNAETLPQRLMFWLCEDTLHLRKENVASPKEEYRTFGERLNAVMELACLSDVRFAELLGLDAACISRYRCGLRSPLTNTELMDAMCSQLLDRIQALHHMRKLYDMTGMPAGVDSFLSFRKWLFRDGTASDSLCIERLLDQIDNYTPDDADLLPLEQAIGAPQPERPYYIGADGMRHAMIRFLTDALQKHASAIWLYSDQNLEWLIGDAAFAARWSALMRHCVQAGIRIRIIHNFNLSPGEMLEGLRSWLPLYCSGLIESYYCQMECGRRFSHTLYVIPEIACIEGCTTDSADVPAAYHYHTAPEIVSIYENIFNSLLKNSNPLAQLQSRASAAMFREMNFLTAIGNTLSLGTMPDEVFYAALSRSQLDAAGKQEAEREWKARRRQLIRMLENGFVHECVPPTEDAVLFSGQCPLELPGETLYYTPEEYAAHVREILRISQKYESYRFFSLPEPVFPHTLLIASQAFVCVSMLQAPFVTFQITHPVLIEAFHEYSDCLKAPYLLDHETAVRKLSQYL